MSLGNEFVHELHVQPGMQVGIRFTQLNLLGTVFVKENKPKPAFHPLVLVDFCSTKEIKPTENRGFVFLSN